MLAHRCICWNFLSDVFRWALRDSYLRFLKQELRLAPVSDGDTLCSGGGSPSLRAPGELIVASSSVSQATWREASGEADSDRIDAWVVGGIDRVGLGVQRFHPRMVRAAGRKCDTEPVQNDACRLSRTADWQCVVPKADVFCLKTRDRLQSAYG